MKNLKRNVWRCQGSCGRRVTTWDARKRKYCHATGCDSHKPKRKAGSSEARGSVCPIANAVALQVLKRAEVGMKKYGVNATRKDLTTVQWLQHLQEELLDAAVYVERLKQERTLNDKLSGVVIRRDPKCKQWPRCACIVQGRQRDCESHNQAHPTAAGGTGGAHK